MTSPLDQRELAEHGFTLVDFLGRSEVRSLRRLFREFGLDPHHSFFASPAHAYGAKARRFHEEAKEIVDPLVQELLPDHEVFMVAAITKGRRRGGPVIFHHDWTYTDERRHRTVFLWCPLVDTGPRNGGLEVIPGSHRWTTAIRPSRSIEVTEPPRLQQEFAHRAMPVAVRAGQAAVFDPALIHGSGRNTTLRQRPAFTAATAPRGVDLLHFHFDADEHLVGAKVDDAFFTINPYGTPPTRYPAIDPWDREVREADLAVALQQNGPQ